MINNKKGSDSVRKFVRGVLQRGYPLSGHRRAPQVRKHPYQKRNTVKNNPYPKVVFKILLTFIFFLFLDFCLFSATFIVFSGPLCPFSCS